jgi:hypothetical protein
MHTVLHIPAQDSRRKARVRLHGWSVMAAKSDAGAVSVAFTAKTINPCGDPGGLLRERKP